tara:strand:+ start:251 stop:418 length:168 start_codon:yes stop_codon:yes gene_type:complete
MDDIDYQLQFEQRDYAEAQLEVLKRIEDQAIQTKLLSMGSLATLIAILVVLGAKL